jgi:AcrR family transcriptional regulator
MRELREHLGRRERSKRDKRERILAAARDLFAEHGVGGVTTQHIADRADVAIGTLFLYASTKAELLIMVQNTKFAAAIDVGLAAIADVPDAADALDSVMVVIRPVVVCAREQIDNGRTYLHELVFGDPAEPNRREGLARAAKLEDGIALVLTRDGAIETDDAATLARVVSAIIHINVTATIYRHLSDGVVLDDIRDQIRAVLAPHRQRSDFIAH